jgi:hypothetical protein
MACKKCGSDWVTATGKDCKTCPHCSKRQRHEARIQGRWFEPTLQKACVECGCEFTAVGLQEIQGRVLCHNPECKKSRRKKLKDAGNARRAAGVFVLPRGPKEKRCCKFSRCGKELIRRDQKDYCDRVCYFAAIDAGEQQFRGRLRDSWAALADWAYTWDVRPGERPKGHDHKLYIPRPACEICGNECNHRDARFCSSECKKKWRGSRQCKCGSVVENAKAYGRVHCIACKKESRRIRRRMYGCYRRRCKTYGGHFNKEVRPKKVFERDGWICHLCNCKTHKVFANDDALSATVDHHPIPLSKGGDHDWHNVRCACKQCNELKGNKWDGQLMFRLAPQGQEGWSR